MPATDKEMREEGVVRGGFSRSPDSTRGLREWSNEHTRKLSFYPERRQRIDLHRPPDFLLLDVEDVLADENTGVVDDDIDMAEVASYPLRGLGNLLRLSDVTLVGERRTGSTVDDLSRFCIADLHAMVDASQ